MRQRKVLWDPQRTVTAELRDYRLVFRGESARKEYKRGGLADLDPERGARVVGVVYWTDGNLDGLDQSEGVKAAYPAGCCRVRVIVQTERGPVTAYTYVRKRDDPPNPPHESYLEKILRGAEEHDLPLEWIQEIMEAAQATSGGLHRTG